MSTPFGHYARYYNLLYKDKDYDGEANFVASLTSRHQSGASDILELGCGTGRHASLLAKRGFRVHGVDRSADMLEAAEKRRRELPSDVAGRLSFSKASLQDVRLDRKFPVVISLFHVFSYLTTNADQIAAWNTAAAHLEPGGVLIFDCWYGPAVIACPPAVRVKRMEDEQIRVIRLAEPDHQPNENIVDVHYHVLIAPHNTSAFEEVRETHRMRYLFTPEIKLFCSRSGLELIEVGEWMTEKSPSLNTWNVYYVVRKPI